MSVFKDKVLMITGGSGFIGQNMQEYMLSFGMTKLINIDIVPPVSIYNVFVRLQSNRFYIIYKLIALKALNACIRS